MMRSSRTLLSLARALAEARPGEASCARLVTAEPLSRAAHAGQAAAAAATMAGGQARGYADGNVPAVDRAFERVQERTGEEPSEDWEYGNRTEHTVVADRTRNLEDYDELIGVIARRRRCVLAHLPFRCWHALEGSQRMCCLDE